MPPTRRPNIESKLDKLAQKWHNVAGDGDERSAYIRIRSGPKGARRVVGRIPLPHQAGDRALRSELDEWRDKCAGEVAYFEVLYTGESTPEDSITAPAIPDQTDNGDEESAFMPGSNRGGTDGVIAYMAAQLGKRNDSEVERLSERNTFLEDQNHRLLLELGTIRAEAAGLGMVVDLYDRGLLNGGGSDATAEAVKLAGPMITEALSGLINKRSGKKPDTESPDQTADRLMKEVQKLGMTSPAVLIARLDQITRLYAAVCGAAGQDPVDQLGKV